MSSTITAEIPVDDDALDAGIESLFDDEPEEGEGEGAAKAKRRPDPIDDEEEEEEEPDVDADADKNKKQDEDDEGGETDAQKEARRVAYAARKRAEEAADDRVRAAEDRAIKAEQERDEARAQAEDGNATAVAATVDSLEAEEKTLKAQMLKAKEEGDSAAELDLQDKWTNLKIDLNTAKRVSDRLTREKTAREARAATDDEDRDARGGRRKDGEGEGGAGKGKEVVLPERFKTWMQRNPWLKDEAFRTETAAMMQIEQELKKAGFDPEEADFYRELDKRARQRLPRIAKHQRESQGYQGRSHVGAGDTGGGSIPGLTKTKDGKLNYKLSKDDVSKMRDWGLDPADKTAREEWAKQRVATLRAERDAKAR